MILKTLVTGMAAAAVVAAAAGGVTSIASTASSGAPSTVTAIQPVVKGIPLPQAPAPELQGPLTDTLQALAGPGQFSGAKGDYVQGGFGRIEGRLADSKYNSAVAKGYLPLTISVADIDQNGPIATANVTATLGTGDVKSMPMTFVQGPSPTGWQLSQQSVTALSSLLS